MAHRSIVRPNAQLVTLGDRKKLKAAKLDSLQLYSRVDQAASDLSCYKNGFVAMLADPLRTSFDVLAFGELRDERARSHYSWH